MNIVVDNRLQTDEGYLEVLCTLSVEVNVKAVYVDCHMSDSEYTLDDCIAKVYSKCVDSRANMFIGLDDISDKIRELGIPTINLNVGEIKCQE